MMRVLVALAAGAVAAGVCGRATDAMPLGLPGMTAVAASARSAIAVRYHRHHRHHRSSGESRQIPEPATEASGDAGAVKTGRWEVAAQLQSQAPGAAEARTPAGAIKTTYSTCITADNPVPAAPAPGCAISAIRRDGERVTWSMTCTNRRGSVHSEGVAQYRGDTMEGTLISRLPRGGGAKSGAEPTIELTQHISGRFLGACPGTMQAAQAPIIPPGAGAGGAAAQWVEPPAAAGSTAPAKSTTEPAAGQSSAAGARPPAGPSSAEQQEAETAAPEEEHRGARFRHAQRWSHRGHHRHWGRARYGRYYSAFGYSGYGTPGFGPRPGP